PSQDLSFRGSSYHQTLEHIKDEELSLFWKKYPASKSCGSDGIHVLLLRALDSGSKLAKDTAMLFNIYLFLGVMPAVWNRTIIYPIQKHKDAKTIDQFRPISLTLMMRRTF
ncbi:hypothetical protein BGZ76_008385, partial [Entomortierella beljakovae]